VSLDALSDLFQQADALLLLSPSVTLLLSPALTFTRRLALPLQERRGDEALDHGIQKLFESLPLG
jgi:hypothetical protein